jgi:hypothetical protein
MAPGLCMLALGLCAAAGSAMAQSGSGGLAEPIPRRPSLTDLPAKPAPRMGGDLQPCPEYGAGFVRQPGSSTCFRLGAGVTLEQQWRDRRSQRADPGATRTEARIGIDARTQTVYGPLRAVVGVRAPLQQP